MQIDFSALASRVAAFSDVLGCVILSSNDALVLGAFPPLDEDGVKPAWVKFAQLGEPDRGFVKFDDEVWAFVKVGQYAAFAVAGGKTRPGILIDHLEQALLVAGESREKLQVARAPGHVDLARATPKATPAPIPEPQVDKADAGEATAVVGGEHSPDDGEASVDPVSEAAVVGGEDPSADGRDPADKEASASSEHSNDPPPLEEGEIDPVALAREFAGLLQEDSPGDEVQA